jgi:SAM-dependent methyltransferase
MNVKYDQIGGGYNKTRRADYFLTERLFYHLGSVKNGNCLDVGCGTGNYTIALFQKGVNITGIDPSSEMLKVAKTKSNEISWLQGVAEEIPRKTESVAGIICSLTIHHWKSLSQAFEEFYRVLKPNGRVVIFTSTPEQMKGYWLNHYFPTMLSDSIRQMPSKKAVFAAMKSKGFLNVNIEPYSVKSDLKDLFLYAGKMDPSLYLNPQVRNGISSFSALANEEEVATGLKQLEDDIVSDKISNIIKQYSNDLGDYLFVVAEKWG